ncbi:YCF48-related protein [Winogradskyella schleiferi]|uniref:YCF48-related protein n=1 Tax=Winogradskyella schleiferi TaxID=2686078 RepID=UPI0015BB239D|nr:YCF48-related protein [Winogradskyella schleiferi]
MKRLLLFFTLAIFTSQSSFSQWTYFDVGIENFSENLYDVFFLNNDIGWIAGNNTILKTTDGGDNWILKNTIPNVRYYGIYFKDESVGWAFGKSTSGINGRIHKTTDGGTTWTADPAGNGTLPWWSMDFADLNNGVIVGQEGQIKYTNDGGDTWYTKTSPSGDAGTIFDVDFYDGLNGVAVGFTGGNGFAIKTTDGGNTWYNTNSNNLGSIRSVSFSNENNGIGLAIGSNGLIYNTYNGGDNWYLEESPTDQSLQSIHHITEDNIIAVGPSGTIITSTVGGIFWDSEITPFTSYLRSVFFNNQNTGWAVGSQGVILKYEKDPLLKVFNEIEKNGSDVPVRTELDYFSLSVSADGSSATIFQNGFAGNENHIFRIQEDPNNNDTDRYGSFETLSTTSEFTEIQYNHPKNLDSNNEQNLRVTCEIFDTLNEDVYFEFSIDIVKPPVLMVHGLWSNGSDAFGNMRTALLETGMYHNYQLKHFNYTNDAFVFENAPTLNYVKNQLKDLCIRNNHSTGKIDLFGHSMGGLVSRFYIQSNQYENDVNKLITFNTPHSGSQWADLLIDPEFNFLTPFLTDLNHNPTNGAIDNLRVNGSFINSLNNNSNSPNYDNIGLHSIVTTESSTGLGLEYTKVIGFAMAAQTQIVDFTMKHFLFNDEINDLVVPFSSQVGGVEFSAYTSQWHSSTGDPLSNGDPNPGVLAKSIELVNKKAEDVAFFDNFGYYPSDLEYNLNYQRSANYVSNETLTIISPIDNTEFNSGDVVSIETNGSSGIINILTSIGSQDTSIQSNLSENTTTDTVLFTLPEDTLGRLEIVCAGFDQNGYADYDSTYIIVTTDAILESIKIQENIIYVAENNDTAIRITGNYSDGVERDITSMVDISYSFSSNNATNTAIGFIDGISEGEDVLTVSINGKIDSAPIVITSASEFYDITLSNEEAILNNNKLTIYPNPTKRVLNINIDESIDEILIYDLTGKQLLTKENSKTIDVSNLRNGIYIVKIYSNNSIISKHFIKN